MAGAALTPVDGTAVDGTMGTAGTAGVATAALVIPGADAVAGIGVDVPAGAGSDAELVTGVIVTPVTLPDTFAFSFLLVMPRASRVARSFAVAAMRASADRGTRAFFGAMSRAARAVVLLVNIAAMFALIALTVVPSRRSNCSSAALASASAVFADSTAATALRTVWMYATACGAVNVCPSTVMTAVEQ